MSSNRPNRLTGLISQSKINKFIKDSKTIQEANFSTVGKGNIYTENTSTKAFLPQSSFYSIIIGSLLTANKKTRYVLDKDSSDHSVTLNKEVNWNNKGQGYPFIFQNPVSQLLDNSKKIIGYITLDGLIYLTKDLETLYINQLTTTQDSTGLKLLNKNNYGIYIDNENNIYKGNNTTNTWELIGSSESITSGSGLNWLPISINTIAEKNNGYMMSGNITLTFPSNPEVGDQIGWKNISDQQILNSNGKKIEGDTSNINIDIAKSGGVFVYHGETEGWVNVTEISNSSSSEDINVEDLIQFSDFEPFPKTPFWWDIITKELYVYGEDETDNRYKIANTTFNIDGGNFFVSLDRPFLTVDGGDF